MPPARTLALPLPLTPTPHQVKIYARQLFVALRYMERLNIM